MTERKARIGLALAGGGVRGLAHVGVLEIMEEAQIPIDLIAGTSMGGIIAGLYAAGVPLTEIKKAGLETGVLDIATLDPNRQGLLGHAKLERLLSDLLGNADITFDDLQIPAAVVATDVETGEVVLLNEGPLVPALLATSAFPLMFGPVRNEGRWLVDGGVVNNLPVDVVRHMGADRVVGVDLPSQIHVPLKTSDKKGGRLSLSSLLPLGPASFDWKLPFLIAESSVATTLSLVNQQRLRLCPPDLLLEIPLPDVGIFVTDKNLDIIRAGERVAREALPALRKIRDRPLPPAWWRWLTEQRHRLRRAVEAYRRPLYTPFPPPRRPNKK